MGFNLVSNLESCHLAIDAFFGSTNLLYYSHIPTAIISLLLSVFVLTRNKKDSSAKLLFAASLFFALWSLLDVILWTSADSRRTMFFWSLINLLENLVTFTTLYFAYVFLEKKDLPFKAKIFFATLFLPYVVFLPTAYNMSGFNVTLCEAEQGTFINYFYFLEGLFFLMLLAYLVTKIIREKTGLRKQIVYFASGVILFAASFSGANIVGSLAAVINPENPDNWKILQYGLFGMPVFLGFLAFLMVRYRAFNIKLIGAQALVAALVALVGSQFFFNPTTTSQVLTGITLIFSGIFGIALMRSVKDEVERKEELQMMADSLASANDKLRKLDSAKSEFISIASHQLRTPLTAVKGFISLVLEGSYGLITGELRDVLNRVYSSNERLIQLVEDLLNVSRIEAGRMEYRYEMRQIEDVLKELFDLFYVAAKDKKLKLTYVVPKTKLPKVKVDGGKIREAISNLIDNAIKYTPKGGVTISAELVDAGEKWVRVSVSDTGVGVTEEERPYLFNKFSRGKNQKRLHANGTGLGLFVVKNMVEAQGGKVSVESAGENMGSKFIIELPVAA